MPRYAYDRLTALDNSFLLLEKPNAMMHVASTGIFEVGPLGTSEGGVDIDRIRRGIEAVLHRIPRYRQRLAWIPVEGTPVWVDDDRFNLAYHVRHTALPRPGDPDQLKQLSARVMEQRLDRTRPLWEMWIVEGLSDDRFAIISKVHHCMIDGVSGVDLLSLLMSPDPEPEIVDPPPFVARPLPTGTELLRREVTRRLGMPLAAARDLGQFAREARDVRREVGSRLRAAAETVETSMRAASPTPLNRPIGPHRRFDWTTLPLQTLREVRKSLGVSLNDVVLTLVTGALRRYLGALDVDLEEIDFRVLAPVSVRAPRERGRLGNQVSAWIVPLPLGEPDPREQARILNERTQDLKDRRQAVGAALLTAAAEWTPATLLSLGARNATRLLPFNLVVTNVPGPPARLYLLGAPLREIYPQVPLADNQALGIALFSYEGQLFFGFNADYDRVPDPGAFVAAIEAAAEETIAVALGSDATAERAAD